jgi:hypothetical protein
VSQKFHQQYFSGEKLQSTSKKWTSEFRIHLKTRQNGLWLSNLISCPDFEWLWSFEYQSRNRMVIQTKKINKTRLFYKKFILHIKWPRQVVCPNNELKTGPVFKWWKNKMAATSIKKMDLNWNGCPVQKYY